MLTPSTARKAAIKAHSQTALIWRDQGAECLGVLLFVDLLLGRAA